MPGRRRLIAALLAGGLALAGCPRADEPRFPLEGPFAPPAGADALVIGFVGTLSGPDAWRGEDAFEGADVGVQVLNRTRPDGALPYELRPLDDRGDADTAGRLVAELVELGTTVGVVYAGPPEGLAAAEDALARAGIPAVLCYGDLATRGSERPHLFQVSPPLAAQAERLAGYLARDRGYLVVGGLTGRSPAGRAAAEALVEAFTPLPGRATVARLGPGGPEPALRRLRRRGVEALVIYGSAGTVSEVLVALRRMGASYRTTAAARRASSLRPRRAARRAWRPQPAAFDLAISPRLRGERRGLVAPETLARGAHYLPLAALRRFRRAFRAWWGEQPTGWEVRGFHAARLIGSAARAAGAGDDVAEVLDRLSDSWLEDWYVSLTSGDGGTTAPDLGLWVVPRRGATVRERRRPRFDALPWVPLARTFASPAQLAELTPPDRRLLFRPPRGPDPAPVHRRMRFGVTTGRADPVH